MSAVKVEYALPDPPHLLPAFLDACEGFKPSVLSDDADSDASKVSP
jgi:hypothetical protein